ncbi:hypothetical protein KJ636_00900 [Patescibacteria group bacterium]|nr:hypothetical protein [Patescibacteria group bacterium]MBU4481091.1 hypothetical protein [Patescibacteria group bacterium]
MNNEEFKKKLIIRPFNLTFDFCLPADASHQAMQAGLPRRKPCLPSGIVIR